MSVEQAEAELERVFGSQLDPACVAAFIKLLHSGRVSFKRTPEAAVA